MASWSAQISRPGPPPDFEADQLFWRGAAPESGGRDFRKGPPEISGPEFFAEPRRFWKPGWNFSDAAMWPKWNRVFQRRRASQPERQLSAGRFVPALPPVCHRSLAARSYAALSSRLALRFAERCLALYPPTSFLECGKPCAHTLPARCSGYGNRWRGAHAAREINRLSLEPASDWASIGPKRMCNGMRSSDNGVSNCYRLRKVSAFEGSTRGRWRSAASAKRRFQFCSYHLHADDEVNSRFRFSPCHRS